MPPSFTLEEIVVESNGRVSQGIVLATARLEAGSTVTEDDLRLALHRIRRLPSVLDADLRLERGIERGKYRLRVLVEEMRPFFFAGELNAVRFSRRIAFDGLSPDDRAYRASHLAGWRRPVGRWSTIWLAADSEKGFQAGWTRHRLFGRPALLAIGFAHGVCCPREVLPLGLDPTFSSWSTFGDFDSTTLRIGWPLTGTRSLRLDAELSRHGGGSHRRVIGENAPIFTFEDRETSRLELAWIDDSTDDPLAPTLGHTWSLAVDLRTLDFDRAQSRFDSGSSPGGRSQMARITASGVRVRSFGQHTWTVSGRFSLGTSSVSELMLDSGDLIDATPTIWDAALQASHRRKAFERRLPSHWGDLWWESSLSWGREGTSPIQGIPGGSVETIEIRTGFVLRNPWGVFRIGATWIDLGRQP